MRFVLFVSAFLISTSVAAHEMTPAYLKIIPVGDGIYSTAIKMLNRRTDVNYYEVSVFDSGWNKIPFASNDRIFKLPHLARKEIKIYFKKADVDKVTYVCTTSKLYKGEGTFVASRICSKIEK